MADTCTQALQRVVFITGASRGIGRAAAIAFAAAGWAVAIGARTLTEGQQHEHQLRRPDGTALAGSLRETEAQVRALGTPVLACPMDLMDSASLQAAVQAVLARFGRVDVLLNNAVYQDRESNALLSELTPQALQRVLWGNVVAPFELAQLLLPHWVAQGCGQLVNVCSGAGRHDPPMPADQGGWGFAYGASKAALARLAGVVNTEYGARGLRAYSVNPGLVSTEAVVATLGDGGALEQRYGALPPQRIASALLWLVSDPRAAPLARKASMIELQDLVRDYAL